MMNSTQSRTFKIVISIVIAFGAITAGAVATSAPAIAGVAGPADPTPTPTSTKNDNTPWD
jgi:hypothetical protein